MRVAVCFFGLVGSQEGKNGVGVPLDPKIAGEYNYKNLINPNNADIFIHSWSHEVRQKLIDYYSPQDYEIEKQIDFSNYIKLSKNIGLKRKIKNLAKKFILPKEYELDRQKRELDSLRATSRWYSSKRVLELKALYESKHGFKYDAVIVTRLDLAFFKPLIFHNYDLNKFYASNWNDAPSKQNNFKENFSNHNVGIGFQDLWFFSNSENMNKFGDLFSNIYKYNYSPHISSYEHAVKCGFSIRYTLYRWSDYELIRRKLYKSVL